MKGNLPFRQIALVAILSICLAPSVKAERATPLRNAYQTEGNCRLFEYTGHQACSIFLRYWDSHGGLAQQGLPITEPISEVSETDGKTYLVQYFERAVFEYHPENAGTEYEVLLSLLGRFFYSEKYPGGAPGQQPNSAPDSILFRETGKRLGGRFLEYWRTHGGLPQQGFPISDEFMEKSDLDGRTYLVQYFERAVFEYHPENAPPNDVLLSQLGTYRNIAKYGGREGDVWRALRTRPVRLPVLGQGETCNPSSGKVVAPQFGEAFGEGPVYPVLGANGAAQISLASATKEGDWYLVKTLWIAEPSFNGPVLVRGGRIDQPGEMRFKSGPNPLPNLELTTPLGGLPEAGEQTWREWPDYTRVRSPGCYAYQVDGLQFTYFIIFEATNN
jgi:hypothetical protein